MPIEHFRQGNGLEFRRRFAIPPDRIVALYVGRVAHEKNLPLLLNAFAQACWQMHSMMLIIAREGPARPSVEALACHLGIAEAVRFLGYLNRDQELPDCYHAADLFLFPSHTETQGLVLIEALAAGLPVIGLPIMGAADIILAGRGSVPVGATVEEMANVLRQLACDANLRGIISQAGRQFAQSWSDTAMAKRLAHTYQHMLDGHTLRQSTGQIQTD
nr:glycosyltransferase [Chitinivorax sp. B]